MQAVLVALKHTKQGEVFGRCRIRESTQLDDFQQQVQFHLHRSCGLYLDEVVFLDKFGNILDAEELFQELKRDPDMFGIQVIHP